MAIKPINSIPINAIKRTQRDQLRADFAEAMENKIEMFELEDDIYNYNTLASAISDAIEWKQKITIERVWRKLSEANGLDSKQASRIRYKRTTDRMYEVKTFKGEDRGHVFVQLKSFDVVEWATELWKTKTTEMQMVEPISEEWKKLP